MAQVEHPTVVDLRPHRPARREPLWREAVGRTLRQERRRQGRTLREVAEEARISLPYLSEVERGRKEASSEILAAAAGALGLSLAEVLPLVHRHLVADRAGAEHRRGQGAVVSSRAGAVA